MSLDIIRQQFPDSIYNPPIEQLLYKKIIAYIVTKNNIVGYIDDRGYIKRLSNPIFSNSNNIPILNGISQHDNSEINQILKQSPIDDNIQELQIDLEKKNKAYDALYDSKNNEVLLLKKEYSHLKTQLENSQTELENTRLEYETTKTKLDTCSSKIINEKI
jgi:hypothetical protein